MGLWWRWQDLNLRPWDYDAPALPPNQAENLGFLKRETPKGETFEEKHLVNKLRKSGAVFSKS